MTSKISHEPAPSAIQSPVDGVLATVAEALATLPDLRHEQVIMTADLRHEQVIMTAAVLTARHEITAHEAVEMASYDGWGDTTNAAWAEAGRLLENARVVDE